MKYCNLHCNEMGQQRLIDWWVLVLLLTKLNVPDLGLFRLKNLEQHLGPCSSNKQQDIYTFFENRLRCDLLWAFVNQSSLFGLFFFVVAFRTIENTQGDTRSFWKVMEFPFHYVKCDGIRLASTGPLSSLDNSIHICYTCGFLLAFWLVSC